jgi:hypothetical protein
MNHKVGDTQLMAALDFHDHGVDRPFPQCFVRARHVDQIRRMSHGQRDAGVIKRSAKGTTLLGGERRGVPLIIVLGEELDGLETDRMSGPDRSVAAPSNRHVGTELACLWIL